MYQGTEIREQDRRVQHRSGPSAVLLAACSLSLSPAAECYYPLSPDDLLTWCVAAGSAASGRVDTSGLSYIDAVRDKLKAEGRLCGKTVEVRGSEFESSPSITSLCAAFQNHMRELEMPGDNAFIVAEQALAEAFPCTISE